jgi:signal transduction histidine kinase
MLTKRDTSSEPRRFGLTARVVAGGVALLLIVAGAFTLMLLAIGDQRQSSRDVQAVDSRIANATELERRVIDLETGLRGFAITRQKRFLQPRDEALKAIPDLRRRLYRATDEESKALLQRLYSDVDSFVTDYQTRQLRAIRDGGGTVVALIKTGEGKRRVDGIRSLFARYDRREAALAAEARRSADDYASTAILIGVLGLLVVPVLIGLAIFLVARLVVDPVRQMSAAARKLKEGDLSVRVSTRTGGAEVGDLADSFNSMAAALQRNQAELEDRNAELESFAYSVSHDLRAPLRSIDGFSQALVEDFDEVLDDTARDYLKRIRAGAARMSEQIDDLLRLSRVSRRELRRERVDVSDLANEVIEELVDADPDREVALRVEDGMTAVADRRLLQIALENLLGNAWKFTGNSEAARIEVASEPADDGAVFLVRDNGAGFDMAYADKLFGVFQRLHTLDEFEGTGIGLATVQRVVYKHGGRVWAEGEVDRGATIRFTLGDQSKEEWHGS